jgi:hypothetical protein
MSAQSQVPNLGDLMPSLVQISNQRDCNGDFIKNVAPYLDVNLHHKEMRRLIHLGMSKDQYTDMCKKTGETRPTKILKNLYGLAEEQCSTLLKKGAKVVESLHYPAKEHRSFVCVHYILDRMTKFDVSMAALDSALEWSRSLPIRDICCMWCQATHTEGYHVRRCSSCQMTYCKDCRIEDLKSGGIGAERLRSELLLFGQLGY